MLLPLLISACGTQQPSTSTELLQLTLAAIPALPPQARQQPSTPECSRSPNCLERLTAWRVSTQKLLTNPE
ncbi:hypothetical protein N5C93_16150 [Pseudomonas nitroreducens]|nr:hypothetical protein [Pseudomonas nitroreducens]MDH1074375.1 hypothetical protein [Pseudomonas nitroreducens]